MRAVVALAALTTVAFAQNTDPLEQRIQQSFQNLRDEPVLFLKLQGADKLGAKSETQTVDLFWDMTPVNGNPNARAELSVFEDLNLVKRGAADGRTLWVYHVPRREYSAATYGAYQGPIPETYMRDVLAGLNTAASGPSAHVTRLLREVYGGDDASYRSWMPGVKPQLTMSGAIEYTLGNPVRRRITFHIDNNEGNGPERLERIDYYDASQVGNQVREISWTITPYRADQIPQGANYYPYGEAQTRGWRPVTPPKPVRF